MSGVLIEIAVAIAILLGILALLVGMPPLGVPLDDFLERLLAAVVHVGGRRFDVADGRRLERAHVLVFAAVYTLNPVVPNAMASKVW